MEQLDFDWVYPGSPHEVFRMATRLDHLEAKADYLQHTDHTVVELRERGGVFRSITQRRVSTPPLPWFPRPLWIRRTITQTQLWQEPSWDGSRRYDADVAVTRAPVRVTGEGRITREGWDATRYTIHLDVISTAPVVGRRVEATVAQQLREAIDGEHEFRLLWLGRRTLGR